MKLQSGYRLKHILLDNRAILIDGLVMVVAIVVTGVVIGSLEFGEAVHGFMKKYEHIELDEIILVVLMSYFYLSIFTLRRFFELRRMVVKANTDPLIGIMNRGRGSELIRRELERIERKSRPSTLIMFDIDRFKHINDTYGHDKGDLVLREVAAIVTREVREHDVLIRWGGEEFIILCPDTTLKNGVELAERLRCAIEAHQFDFIRKVTASFGVTALVAGQSLRDQINRVDENLYESKAGGRNTTTAR